MRNELAQLLNDVRELPKHIFDEMTKRTTWCLIKMPEKAVQDNFMFPSIIPNTEQKAFIANYRYTSYKCPNCGMRLYKTVFEHDINIPSYLPATKEWTKVPIVRLFTCLDCEIMIAAPKYRKIKEGILITPCYDKKNTNLPMYWIKFFNDHGNFELERKC